MRQMGWKLVKAVPDIGFRAKTRYKPLPEYGPDPFGPRIFRQGEPGRNKKRKVEPCRAVFYQLIGEVQGILTQA